MYFLTVDPGIELGWALWYDSRALEAPVTTGVLYPKKDLEWTEGVRDIMRRFERETFRGLTFEPPESIKACFCEWPAFFEDRGMASARGGSLVKLACAVGMVMQICSHFNCQFEQVPVIKWKGQMPKEAVINRIRKRLPGHEFKSHAWDAVGIGLYVKGHFE